MGTYVSKVTPANFELGYLLFLSTTNEGLLHGNTKGLRCFLAGLYDMDKTVKLDVLATTVSKYKGTDANLVRQYANDPQSMLQLIIKDKPSEEPRPYGNLGDDIKRRFTDYPF